MSKILVTGGAGFIGSNLCEALLEQGHEVRCLDNFSTGRIENVQHLLYIYRDRFKIYLGDICDIANCRESVEGMEYVLNQAALGSVPRSINDPITTNNVNISGFLNMLVASREAKIRRFIFAASSSTYGDLETLPKVEDKIGKPLSPYAITKYVNELYADVFAKQYGMEYIGLRYFNVFGPNQDPYSSYAAVIPMFCKQFMSHQSPIINGNGEYSRDFTYVDNVVQMNILAMQTTNKEAVNQIYNTAFGEQTTLNQLVKYIRQNLAQYDPAIANIEATYGPTRAGDIPHSLASIEKAKRLLGYNPLYNVEKGLKEACKWYWRRLR